MGPGSPQDEDETHGYGKTDSTYHEKHGWFGKGRAGGTIGGDFGSAVRRRGLKQRAGEIASTTAAHVAV